MKCFHCGGFQDGLFMCQRCEREANRELEIMARMDRMGAFARQLWEGDRDLWTREMINQANFGVGIMQPSIKPPELSEEDRHRLMIHELASHMPIVQPPRFLLKGGSA